MKHSHLIHDWNRTQAEFKPGAGRVLLNDESLRDGLQSPSVKDPTIEQKIEVLHLMEDLGINMLDIGLPGAGPRAYGDVERLAREIAGARMKIKPNCAARTHKNDITPVAEISQKTGIAIECATFIGSSPIRRYTENWSDDFLQKTTADAVTYARSLGLEVMYVTEDTSRCDPETIKRLYTTAIECGARAIVVCDTCGHATPHGVRSLIQFVMDEVVKPSGEKIRVDWHGHCDRGLGLANSFAALEAGADCVHACAIGIGERVGNTQMDQMLVNLKLMGVSPWLEQDLSKLREYCEKVSQYTGVPIPKNYPVVGADAFRTATGVHASAVIKAIKKGDLALADEVYSGVPASEFGLVQTIEIGHMSGKSNIIHWLETRGMELDESVIERIYQRAKQSDRLLTEAEILECCAGAAKT